MENYKTIIVKISPNVSKRKIDIVLSPLFSNYPSRDIYYSLKKNYLKIFLRALNYEKFIKEVGKKIKIKDKNILKIVQETTKKIGEIGSYGIKSGKRIYIDYNKERKVKNRGAKEKSRNSKKYSEREGFSMNNINFPKKYTNKIICGDSLKVLKKIPDNSVDLVFTSPPYNFGLEYSSTKDAHSWDKYFRQLFEIFDECIRVLKYGGRFVVNIQPLFSDYVPSHHIVSNYFISKGLLWKGEIIWEKNNYNCKYTAWGSWKSPSSPYLKYTWEFVEVFAKGSLKKDGRKEDADITAEEFKKWVVAKWSIAPERKMKEFGHPAMFPEELAQRVIKLFSFKNDVILDPFNGVGTTTLVAKILGRRFIGIDISKDYCRKAEKRIKSILV